MFCCKNILKFGTQCWKVTFYWVYQIRNANLLMIFSFLFPTWFSVFVLYLGKCVWNLTPTQQAESHWRTNNIWWLPSLGSNLLSLDTEPVSVQSVRHIQYQGSKYQIKSIKVLTNTSIFIICDSLSHINDTEKSPLETVGAIIMSL